MPVTGGDNREVVRHISSPVFVGRAEQLEALDAALAAARAGAASTVLVSGEAGIGKTRLLEEFAARASAGGARVLIGNCIELGDGELPHAPLAAILRQLERELAPEELAAVLGPARAVLDPAAPDNQASRLELVLAMLGRLGELAPAVIAIEDLHWADRSTRDLLAFLIRSLRREPIVLVATYRSDELHRRHPLRAFLTAHAGGVERIELARFDEDELVRLVTAIRGEAPAPELAARLLARSEGNAFLAEELLAAGGTELPDTLREAMMAPRRTVVGRRQAALRVAACAGAERAPSPALRDGGAAGARAGGRAARGRDPPRAGAQRRRRVRVPPRAAARGGVRGRPAGRARPPARRDRPGARRRAGPGERGRRGRGRGAAPTTGRPRTSSTRRSRRRSPPVAPPRGSPRSRRPSATSSTRSTSGTASSGAEARAGMDRIDLTRRAADAANLAADRERAIALARDAAARLDAGRDPVRAGLVQERLGRYLWLVGREDEAAAACREAVATLPADPPSAERARVVAAEGQLLMLRGHARDAIARCEEALAVARAVGARAEQGHALNTLGACRSGLGEHEAGEACLREALAIALELELSDDIGRAYVNLERLHRPGRPDRRGRAARARRLRGQPIAGTRHRLPRDAAERGGAPHVPHRALGRRRAAGGPGARAASRRARGGQRASDPRPDRGRTRRSRRRAGRPRACARAFKTDASAMWTAPVDAAVAELELSAGRAGRGAGRRRRAGWREAKTRSIPFFTARLHWVGLRAEAELAEAARARVRPRRRSATRGPGPRSWPSGSPGRSPRRRPARPHPSCCSTRRCARPS